jgi:replicative DNA helicase
MENFRNINPVKVDKTTIIKLPPQVLDLEEAVLGVMIDKKKGDVIDILQPDAFYKDAHKHILKLLFSCLPRRNPLIY